MRIIGGSLVRPAEARESEQRVDEWRGDFDRNNHQSEKQQGDHGQAHADGTVRDPEAYQVRQHAEDPFEGDHLIWEEGEVRYVMRL